MKLGRGDDELGGHRLHSNLFVRAGEVGEPVGHQPILYIGLVRIPYFTGVYTKSAGNYIQGTGIVLAIEENLKNYLYGRGGGHAVYR